MREGTAALIHRADYQQPAYWIRKVELTFDLDPAKTIVGSKLQIERNHAVPHGPLRLHGEELNLLRVLIDGSSVSFRQEGQELIIESAPDADFQLEIRSTCAPEKNSALSGLYTSGGSFFTQCEAEGFRRITYFLDRPDVMAVYTVTLRADAAKYPVLLANGNLVETGSLDNGRHFATWHDPFPKPSYLFAVVAGDLVTREQRIRTRAGKDHLLQVYVRRGDLEKTEHAMNSLVASIVWDEARFGLPLDLERFMVVGVSDFNMGAMENKGLNIFNTSALLASPATATDADFARIESIVAHEYFHNWTGNRVTCRDWFQLSLKEGLTVFRDQEFSMDMAGSPSARAVCRIRNVRALRALQFPEDSGAMAHPVRPDSYSEINNFYTATVYEKGSEVVRMYQTLVGRKGFEAGMKLYFERHDGQAVTCDDFAQAIADANPGSLLATRLDAFKRWYSQAGTPRVKAEGADLPRGTRIVLHLKEDAKEFLEPWKLTDLIQKFSDYVSHPILVERKNDKGEALLEQANRANALWRRPKAEVTDEQYTELYKHIASDFEAPLYKTHIHMEGTLELSGVLFLPKKPPFDLFEQGKRRGVQLFVKRVFIMDDCEELLPQWLRFIKGVVDSDDLPLNVSREILQDSGVVRTIRKQVIKKSLEMIEHVAENNPADYATFFQGFGVVLKEGAATDVEFKDRLAKLLRYESTKGEGLIALDTYKSRMKEGQKEIYYLYGSGKTAVASSPYLESLTSKGYEVLLMTDPVDEWVTEALGKYDDLAFVSAMSADVSANESDAEKAAREEDAGKVKPLLDRIREVLGDRIKDVHVSPRLTSSPACLALSEGQIPAYMEAVLRANGRPVPKSPRVFEVNPKHPLIEKLLGRVSDSVTADAIELLFDQAKLVEGSTIDDPQKFAERLSNVLAASLG